MVDLEDRIIKAMNENPEILLMLCAKKTWKGNIECLFVDRLNKLSVGELPIAINRLKPLVDDMIEQWEKATGQTWTNKAPVRTANSHKI